MNSEQIIIVGAGISGLCAAIELEKQGYSPTIIEAENFVGGRVKTNMIDGYPLDVGFQVLLTAYPAAMHYLNYDALDLRRFKPGAIIVTKGKYHAFGDFMRAPELLAGTVTSSVGTLKDKWLTYQMSNRLRRKSFDKIFSAPQMDTRSYLKSIGYSDGMIRNFFEPFYGGIFLDDKLGTSSRMLEFTFKMFSQGYAAIPAEGMQAIPKQLLSHLRKTEIILSTRVEAHGNGEVILSDNRKVPCDLLIDSTGMFSKKSPEIWHSCTTHYFYTSNNPIKSPLIALVTEEESPVNTFHFVSDVVGRRGKEHLLSATCIGENINSEPSEVAASLKTHCGIEIVRHVHSDKIKMALPVLDSITYGSGRKSDFNNAVVACGDISSNGSINGAMEAGRSAAAEAVEALAGREE